MKKEILKHNDKKFLFDLSRVRDVMVWTDHTGTWFHVKKSEVIKMATGSKIHYYITDKIFVHKRDVMVIE